MPLPVALDHVVIAVSDPERSRDFYRDVVGVEPVPRGSGWAYRIGDVQLNVHSPGHDFRPVAAHPVAPGGSDLCLRWDGPIEDAIAHLERHGVPVEEGPVDRNGARGAGRSVYFRDPDGSLLEFMAYAA
jgi:catechol 2,3-dioxygenase-like lactoylglutathione lyase family enzyme